MLKGNGGNFEKLWRLSEMNPGWKCGVGIYYTKNDGSQTFEQTIKVQATDLLVIDETGND